MVAWKMLKRCWFQIFGCCTREQWRKPGVFCNIPSGYYGFI